MKYFKFIILLLVSYNTFAGGGGIPCYCLTAGVCNQAINCGNPTQNSCLLGGGTWFFQEPCSIPLPIKIGGYSYEIYNDVVHINFTTLISSDIDCFLLEVSRDGSYWQNVDTIVSTNGPNNYNIIDYNPFNGLSYYRLIAVDINGSKEVLFILDCEYYGDQLMVYPNPVTNIVIVEYNNLINDINITNELNVIVYSKSEIENKQCSLYLNGMSNGIYYLNINSNNLIIRQKLIIIKRD